MVFSRSPIASRDWTMAASGESSPESMRRWSSKSEIIGMFSWRGPQRFYEARKDGSNPLPLEGGMDTRTPRTTHLSDAQRTNWLRLNRSDRIGPHGVMAQTPRGSENAPGMTECDSFQGCRS